MDQPRVTIMQIVTVSGMFLIPMLTIAAAWGTLTNRLNYVETTRLPSLEARMDRQVGFIEGVAQSEKQDAKELTHQLDSKAADILAKLEVAEQARASRNETFTTAINDLAIKMTQLSVQMGYLNNNLTADPRNRAVPGR